jgi:lysophospholipase L1-like esterase
MKAGLLSLLLAAGCASPQVVGPTDARIARVGRFDDRTPGASRFAWTGTTLRVRFDGTGLVARFVDAPSEGEANRVRVTVDGVSRLETLEAGAHELVVARGLPEGTHTASIVRATEARYGPTTFEGLVVDGVLLPPPGLARPRLLFLGDSLAAGFGNLGVGPECAGTSAVQDGTRAFPALTAARLDMDAVVVAQSGIGVLRNDQRDDPLVMAKLWRRALPSDATLEVSTQHAFTGVVVFLGANDFFGETPPEQPFVAAMHALLDDVRRAEPDAPLWVLTPILSDAWPEGQSQLTTVRAWMRAIVDARIAAGDDRIHLFELPDVEESEGMGCMWHPTLATHERWSALLAAELSVLIP